MDLDYSNDMINSSTGRMTTEHWVKHFWYISIIQSWHNVGKSGRDFLKVGVAGGVYFPCEIIFLMTS